MVDRLVLPVVVAVGLAVILATEVTRRRAAERFEAGAAAAGHVTTQLAVREIG